MIPAILNNNYLLSFLLACCWGPSFMFIKIALASFSPLIIVELRLSIGGLLLYIIIKLCKLKLPTSGKLWLHCGVMGLFSAALPFSLFVISELYISSALAGIVNGLTPIFTVILAHFFLKSESITFDRFLGVLAGFAGFCTLLLPTILDHTFNGDSLALFLVALASLSYAIAMIYGKHFLPPALSLNIPSCQIICAALILLPFTIYFQWASHSSMLYHDYGNFNGSAWGAILGLAVLGTVFAFIVYYRILKIGGAVVLSMAIYLLPVFSSFFGVIFLHEHLNIEALFGMIMIIIGMAFVNGAIKPSHLSGIFATKRQPKSTL